MQIGPGCVPLDREAALIKAGWEAAIAETEVNG
jgi:hypothetical protein